MHVKSGCNLARGFGEGQPAAARCAPVAPVYARTAVRCALLCALAAFSTLLACAKRPTTPTAIAIEEASARAYRSLVESVGIDSSPVRDKTIVLDPGHGGGYRGAVGRRGTAEADVNLAVALFLWGLLDDAGARVTLTRSADRDFVGGALAPPAIVPLATEGAVETNAAPPPPAHPDSLPADLAARVARANHLDADLFLSIHHNADASGDTTRNQTQTFYRLGDPGPSLDAAQAIHRHLVRNLTPAGGQVLPGNYHVLRNSNAAAAVLGEASFLTNPGFEEKLLRIDRVELEATAYFLGIVDHFARGVAFAHAVAPRDTTLDRETVDLRARFAGDRIDPATVEIALDGTPLPVRLAGGTEGAAAAAEFAAAAPAPLANGWHEVLVSGRTLGGNAAAPARARFEIRRPPAEIRAEPWPPWNGTETRGPLGLEVVVRDRFGTAVADSTAVELTSPVAARALTRGGRAWFRLASPPAPDARWTVAAGAAAVSVAVVTPGAPPHRSGTVVDRATGKGVPGAEIRAAETGRWLGRANPDGEYAVPVSLHTPAPGGPAYPDGFVARAPGYLQRRIEASPVTSRVAIDPVLGGVLHGRRVAVDAAGGGADPVFVSPTGVRASDTALDVARRFALDLARAGGSAELVRDEDLTLPDLGRVEIAEQSAAARYVRIGADRVPRIRHYPGSRRGEALARAIAREIKEETGLALDIRAEVTPVLLATSMPAVEILLPAPIDPAGENEHLDPDFRRRVARALLLGMAIEAGLDPSRLAVVRLKTPDPHVLLDGAIVLPARGGEALVRGIEPGPAGHEAASLGADGAVGRGIGFTVEGPAGSSPPVLTVTLEPAGTPGGRPAGARP